MSVKLTRIARARRHECIVAAYRTGLTSRAVAEQFGMSDSHVRAVVRLYEAARPVGRPSPKHKEGLQWS